VELAIMKSHRFAVSLTVLNLVILIFVLVRAKSITAPEVGPVIRGRASEIVDDQGRVRTMIKLFPASPTPTMSDGTMGYPETVPLRFIDSKGAPNVKVAATEDGSAVSFGGESNPTHVQSLARGANTSLKLVNHDGREQLVRPE
jgi:hypothetical protein